MPTLRLPANMTNGKVALVVGANRGVGLVLVTALIEYGYRVWGSVRPETMLDESVGDLRNTGASIVQIDYTNEETISDAVEEIQKSEDHLDLLVNCGGVNTKPREWDGGETVERSLSSNLPIPPATQKLRVREATDGGRLSYRMAKAALNQQTASLAVDFREKNINVVLVAVHPGRVPTRMSGGKGHDNLQASAKGMIKIVEDLNRQTSGRYLNYDGSELPW
ncbi:NAD(P)-binding protein [Hypoxylon sp. EC38]|nr:NAD(P)-binding protein [Hypoxylon sp. EC38]